MVNKIKENENTKNDEIISHSKEITGKKLLLIECLFCFTALALLLILCSIASYCKMSDALRLVLILIGLANLLINCFVAFYLEVHAGCHICEKCGHNHQPSYLKSMISPHIGWTRYMKCPKCGQYSWQKKKFKN